MRYEGFKMSSRMGCGGRELFPAAIRQVRPIGANSDENREVAAAGANKLGGEGTVPASALSDACEHAT